MSSAHVPATIASSGYASGPLFVRDTGAAGYLPSGDAATEAARLKSALATAAGDVAALVARSRGDAADILAFQQAMLEDDALAAPAFAAIAAGSDAMTGWREALAAEIHGYEASGDAYFRARASDLEDIAERVRRLLAGAADTGIPPGAILLATDISPSLFLATDWTGGGIALRAGSAHGHVAMLARSRGIPMLVGLGDVGARNGDFTLLDAEHGRLTVLPDTDDRHEFLKASITYAHLIQHARSHLAAPAVTADGARIEVHVNIARPADVEAIDIATCDGVGLMRTEFLFDAGLPDEESQYQSYRRVLAWAGSKPVTIRTVDAGGDKPVPGYTVAESNPFLGLRGLRLSLTRPDVFRVQVRALLRAAPHGNLKVMFPMVTVVGEVRAAAALFAEEAAALAAAGIAHRLPPLGIMVEVPAVALHPGPFADCAFFSIGSNDLTQYVMAAARDNGAVAALHDVRHPAVLALIGQVARFGDAHGVAVSLCGDAGGDPAAIPALLAAGLRTLSVAPAQLALAKAAIAAASTH